MKTKRQDNDNNPVLEGIDWTEFEDVEWKPKPVNLKLAKIRAVKRQMREIVADLLHSENENGDSRAEVMLDTLVAQAEQGNLKATEMVLKLLGEFDDKQKVEVSGIPSIKIVVDDDKTGIRDNEKS